MEGTNHLTGSDWKEKETYCDTSCYCFPMVILPNEKETAGLTELSQW